MRRSAGLIGKERCWLAGTICGDDVFVVSVVFSGVNVSMRDVRLSGQARPAGVTCEKKPCLWKASMRSRWRLVYRMLVTARRALETF